MDDAELLLAAWRLVGMRWHQLNCSVECGSATEPVAVHRFGCGSTSLAEMRCIFFSRRASAGMLVLGCCSFTNLAACQTRLRFPSTLAFDVSILEPYSCSVR